MATKKSWAAQIEFWLSWMLVLGISWPGIAILTTLLSDLFGSDNLSEINLILTALIGGVLVGIVQWFFLRPAGPGAALFILGTAIGWAAGLALVVYRVDPVDSALLSLGRGFLAGLVLGLFQWPFLRVELRNGWVWLMMSAAGWALALGTGSLLAHRGALAAVYEPLALGSLAALLGWVVVGLVAVVFLIGLFPRQRARESDQRIRWLP